MKDLWELILGSNVTLKLREDKLYTIRILELSAPPCDTMEGPTKLIHHSTSPKRTKCSSRSTAYQKTMCGDIFTKNLLLSAEKFRTVRKLICHAETG
jgi:hypothetical protein